ncbi:hypothetical protein AA313_de0204273 [Arthrobotrys entomopaga]|nr:hypothetical protein AA313_de0204273 [Arthrobotrys entomopaga]
MEWIEGASVRDFLNNTFEPNVESSDGPDSKLERLMEDIGEIIAKLHDIDIIHGDLTTSNLMLRQPEQETEEKYQNLPGYDVVLIDFGLGQVSASDEDKALSYEDYKRFD